jgi:pSer/pThr/pTyr-binding forkhead associated (FHA) protein
MAGRLFSISHAGGISIPLNKREMLVGRAEGCDICIRDPAVSSRHCLLKFTGATWVVVDLKSKNGTQVNDGAPVTERVLRSGDTLVVAHRHRYRIEYTPSVEAERFSRVESETFNLHAGHPPSGPATQRLKRSEGA